jgi:ATP/maltotriose-dependent transcriptional regulator MalT
MSLSPAGAPTWAIAWIDRLAADPDVCWRVLAELGDHADRVIAARPPADEHVDELERALPDDEDTTRALAQRASTLRASDDRAALTRCLATLAWAHLEHGDWRAALTTAHQAAALALPTGQPLWHARATGALALVHGLRGEQDRFGELVAALERRALSRRIRALEADAQLIRGQVALAEGRHDVAYAHLSRLVDPGDPAHHPGRVRHGAFDLVEAAMLAHADAEGAAAAVVRALAPTPVAVRRAVDALLADDDDVDAAFAHALTAARDHRPLLRARLHLAHGRRLRRQRRMIDSRLPLQLALETFDALGARPLAARARQELRASGASKRAHGEHARDALTAQERQIARLAAQGLSNREIAQRLFLSPRTIGSHLYRVYPKLGVSSRAQLRDVLAA